MDLVNYEHKLWALIYDQYNQGRHEHELAFYCQLLRSCRGRVLEVACGTGMILLSLLGRGVDAYGFDISAEMLEVLRQKATASGLADKLSQRVTKQDMVNFRYDESFAAIIIPARSFLHLTDQDSQIRCLRNINSHLQDNGFLALNFFNPNLGILRPMPIPVLNTGFTPHIPAKTLLVGKSLSFSGKRMTFPHNFSKSIGSSLPRKANFYLQCR